jgi:hypothetical protein
VANPEDVSDPIADTFLRIAERVKGNKPVIRPDDVVDAEFQEVKRDA